MKKIVLVLGMALLSSLSFSQYVEVQRDRFPKKEWYTIIGEEFEGVQYLTADDDWIMAYLTQMLAEDDIDVNKPDRVEYENGRVFYMAWEYVTKQGDKVLVTYIKNRRSSDISFYYFEEEPTY